MPAHDYVLKCSHLFNVLDARGAIGVTERARYFVRMRDLARQVATLFGEQRSEQGFPLLHKLTVPAPTLPPLPACVQPQGSGPFDFLLEVGSEELPVADVDSGLEQLRSKLGVALKGSRLNYADLRVDGTPRRLVAYVRGLDARQSDQDRVIKGPATRVAFDEQGNPTKAALGFARGQGVEVVALQKRAFEGKDYVVAVSVEKGRDATAILAAILPGVVGAVQFAQSMRWNASGVSFSRPLRWYVALLDEVVVPFEYAGVRSGRVSRGIRPLNCPSWSSPVRETMLASSPKRASCSVSPSVRRASCARLAPSPPRSVVRCPRMRLCSRRSPTWWISVGDAWQL